METDTRAGDPFPDFLQREYPFRSCFFDLQVDSKETAPGSGSFDPLRLHYLDEGAGEAVLMLHGNPTWSFFYRNIIRELRDSFRCVAPDHIGCGLSSKPQRYGYRLSDHIENLATLVDSLNLESFHLIVHDWGGPIGMALAERMPEAIRNRHFREIQS